MGSKHEQLELEAGSCDDLFIQLGQSYAKIVAEI